MVTARDDKLFRSKAPWIITGLMNEFKLITVEDACAILGNIGHECGGFHLFQEQKPLVPGSRGGFGWAQWTGPRRKAFEAFCAERGYDLKSDQANFEYLVKELKTTEAAAMPALKKAIGLRNKVEAFERGFERAHPKYKHYDSRMTWAERAADEFAKAGRKPLPWLKIVVIPPPPDVEPVPPLVDPVPKGTQTVTFGALLALIGGAILAFALAAATTIKEFFAWLL